MKSFLSFGESAIIFIVIGFIIIALLIKFILVFSSISSDLKIVNLEISRAHGKERAHWKRRKRRIWINALFPFI